MKLFSRTIQRIWLTAIVILLVGFAMFANWHESEAAISRMINFAGKVTNTDGSEVTDGNYNFVYSLYNVSSGGSPLWTETLNAANVFSATIDSYNSGTFTYTYSGATATSTLRIGQHLTNAVTGEAVLIRAFDTDANTITVVDGSPAWSAGQAINTRPYVEGGVIDVNLGSVTDLTSVDFDQPLYLEITFNGEVMQPRKLIASAAQAFNADMLDGYHSTDFANLAQDSIVTGEWTFSSVLTVATSSTETALSITQSGTGDIVNLIGNLGQEVFTVTGVGNVGIGTSTPENKLDIVGDLGIKDQNELRLYELSSNGQNYVGFRASSTLTSDLIWTLPTTTGTLGQALMVNSNGDLEWGTASEGTVSAGLAGQFPYYAANGDTLTGTSTLFLSPTGRIGIGTSSPSAKLTVWGDGAGANQLVNFVNSASTSLFTVLENGNIGIGTSSPMSTLAVNGITTITNQLNVGSGGTPFANSIANFFGNVNSYLQVNVQNTSNGGSASTDYIATANDGTDSTYYLDMGINSSGYNNPLYTITSAHDSYLYASDGSLAIGTASSSASSVLKFHTGGTLAANERMRISSTGFVGIGTSSPYAKLTVWGSGTGSNQLANFVNSASTSLFTILENGNVGIGATSPAQQLDITKNFQMPNTTFASQYGVIYKNGSRFIHDFNYGNNGTVTTGGGNTFLGINSGNFTSGSTATLATHASYNTGVGTAVLSSNTTGYSNTAVGNGALFLNTTGYLNTAIGQSSMSSNTTGLFNAALGANALGTNISGSLNVAVGYYAGNYTSGGASNAASSNSIYLGYDTRSSASGNSNEIVIGSGTVGIGSNTVVLGNNSIVTTKLNGKVGVGTSTPLTKLHVVGGDLVTRPAMTAADVLLVENSADKSTAINLLSSFSQSSYIAFSNEQANGAGYISYLPSSYMMQFSASGTIPMVVSGNGHVGIGTSTNPEEALHVRKGSAGTTRPTWSDADVAIFENGSSFDTSVQIMSANNRSSILSFSDNNSRNIGSIAYSHANNAMSFTASSTLGMTIANTGFIGIGTTNPLSKLSLQGTVGQSVFSIASSTGDSIFYIDAYGKIGIGTNSPTSALNISSASGSQLKLEYTGSSHAATFTVDSAGLFTIESNEPGDVYIDPTSKFGVGTSSPASALSVYGDVFIEGASRYVNFGTVVGTSGYGIRDNSGTLQIKNSGTDWTNVALIGTGNTGWVPRYYGNTNYLEATSSMYISNAGYVGIGVTNPTSQLALGGNIDMNNHDITEIGRLDIGSTYGYGLRFNGSNNSMITWGNDSTHQFGGVDISSLKINTGADDSGSGVTFGPYGDAPTVSFTPSGTMTLNGYAYIGGGRLTLSEVSSRASSSILVQTSQGIPFLEFATSTGEVFMFVNKDGWLGLNTDTPDTFLHVGSANPDKVSSGENAYVEGSVEIDNILYVDGAATSTFAGSLDIGRNLQMTNTTFASPYGITFRNGSRFIHDFNYGNNGVVTTDGANTFVGINSGNLSSGSTATFSYHSSQNTGFGNSTLTSVTTGYGNTALGSLALYTSDSAAGNTAVGAGAMYFTTSGGYNTALGTGAMYSNVSGINNTATGRFALFSNVSGHYNIAEGYNSGMYIADGVTANTTSDYSIYIGALSKALADDGQNEIVIGYDATGAGSNSVVLGNDSILKTILKGNVGIGTSSPSTKLTVWGSGTGVNQLVNFVDSASTTLFTVLENGNVGIGTSTPVAKLSLVNSTAGDADNIFTIASSSDVFRVTGGGDVYADGSFIDTGADYAEYFSTTDNNLSAGEVVCVDVTENNAVKRCERASDGNVMGIVSTKPAIIGNAKPGYASNRNYAIVGMLGQVPAKVSDENGSIRPGDSLTSASLAGYIMKANAGDSTVGVALESFGNQMASGAPSVVSTGEIKVLISRRNKSLTVEMVESTITEHIANMEIEDEVQILIANAVNNLDLGNEIQPIVDEQINLFDQRLTVEFDSYDNRLTTIAASIDSLSARMGLVESGINSINEAQLRADSQISALNEKLILMEAGNYNLGIIKVDPNNGLAITDNEYFDENEPIVSVVEIETATTTMKTAFVVNQLGDGDVVDFQADGVSIVNIADSGKVSVVGEMSVDGRLMVCSGAGCGAALDEAVDGTMGDMGVEGKVVAGAFESVCDDGFVWVPGSAKYGTMPGFCVMSDEARNGENNIPSIDSGNAIWTNVSQGEAQLACQTMGDNYHLINENEWLTIAENILRVSENDINADMEGLQLAISDSTGTSEFNLSNGNKIYNLAGSIKEWTDMIVTKAGLLIPSTDDWQEYYEITDFKGFNIAPPYFYDSSNGIGRIKIGDNTNNLRGFVRGETSLYDLDLSNAPTLVDAEIGFRCAK